MRILWHATGKMNSRIYRSLPPLISEQVWSGITPRSTLIMLAANPNWTTDQRSFSPPVKVASRISGGRIWWQDMLRGELSSPQWYEDQFFISETCLYPSLDSLISFHGVGIPLWELCYRWYYAERNGVELRVEWLWSMINTFETKCPPLKNWLEKSLKFNPKIGWFHQYLSRNTRNFGATDYYLTQK